MADPTPTLKAHESHVEANLYESCTVVMATHPDGTLFVEICDECHFVKSRCNHSANDWYDERGIKIPAGSKLLGVTLRCRLCGLDGT